MSSDNLSDSYGLEKNMELSISDRFKDVRNQLGFSQQDFAKELGVSQAHISSIERGKDNPSSPLVKLLCYKFNVDEKWLIEGSGGMFPTFDDETDEGLQAKYRDSRVLLDRLVSERIGTDLRYTVQAVSSFLGLLIGDSQFSKTRTNHFLKIVSELIEQIYLVQAKTRDTRFTYSKTNDLKRVLACQRSLEDSLKIVEHHVRQLGNYFLVQNGHEELL